MSRLMRSLLAVLAIGGLMVALVVVKPSATSAANLTGGTYTYVINGEEATFTFDPVVRQNGVLLPLEVFQKFGITIEDGASKTMTLSKDTASAKVTTGTTTYYLNGSPRNLSTAPLRLNGRVFLPADLLKEFGVDFAQDGNYVIMRNYAETVLQPKKLSEGDWNTLKWQHGFTANVKSDTGSFINSEFYLLTPDMVNASNLDITYGNRARLSGMLQSNTLVLVKLSNGSTKSGGLVTSGAFLVDDLRNEYDVTQVLDIGYGLLSNKLAPGADRWGVLVYPKPAAGAMLLSVYYDNNGTEIGTFRTN